MRTEDGELDGRLGALLDVHLNCRLNDVPMTFVIARLPMLLWHTFLIVNGSSRESVDPRGLRVRHLWTTIGNSDQPRCIVTSRKTGGL